MRVRPASKWTRRMVIQAAAGLSVVTGTRHARATPCGDAGLFAGEAARMRDLAVAAGDQAYGAVLVLDGCIVGCGPSRVIQDNDIDAHAERVALWDAQKRLGRSDLSGAVIYSTSRPCMVCQPALAKARVARMYVGPDAMDAGTPKAG